MDNRVKAILFGLGSIILVVGGFDLSYGYYNFLKTFICGMCILGFVSFENSFYRVVFVLIGILYNPAFPIYLNDKMTWVYLDVLIAGLFLERSLKLKDL